jgi:DNA-directed RNA polymerase specialized sigma24 family protein
MKFRWFGKRVRDRSEYADEQEFVNTFECEKTGLQRLSILLTANSLTANRCLNRALRECIASSSVSKEWALSWARRMVIRNAIGLLIGNGNRSFANKIGDTDKAPIAFAPDDSESAIAISESILDLPQFERFVFVICVLERYSIHDCALLLGKSPREVKEVQHRVGNQLGEIDGGGSSQRFSDMSRRPVLG